MVVAHRRNKNTLIGTLPLLIYLLMVLSQVPRACNGWTSTNYGFAAQVSNSHLRRQRMSMSLRGNEETDAASTTFPMSTRQALIQKAKALDSSLETSAKGSYSSSGWSNRLGTALTPASIPGVYTADRPFMWNKIDVGCRMTVICLPGNELWIHSPVPLDGPLQKAISTLGQVTHVISPNYEHVKFAKQWAQAYPDAHMWACPGLTEREPQVDWDGEIPYGIRPISWNEKSKDYPMPEGFWDTSEIQPLHIDCEVNPFTGRPFFNEVVFYHKASKTLLTTDLYWNYPKGDGITNSNFINQKQKEQDFGVWELAPAVDNVPVGSKLWKAGMDKVFRPFYMNLMIQGSEKQERFQNIAKFICDDWDVETLIPAHGDVIRGKGLVKTVLEDHFNLV